MTEELEIIRGNTKTFRVTAMKNSVVLPLSGYTCYLTVKHRKTDSDADAIIGPVTGTIIDSPNGVVDFEINGTLSDVEAGTYYLDVKVDNGDAHTIIEGTLTVILDVKHTAELDEELYVTPLELRTYLQYDTNDYPTEEDMRFYIKFSMKRLALDIDSSDENILFIATLLFAKYQVLRGLAARSIKTGYVQVNAEGRTITKAYQEFVLDAENSYQEYKEFLLSVGRQEAMSTNFMDDTSIVSSWTRNDIIAVMNGTSNALDDQYGYRYNYFWRRRSS